VTLLGNLVECEAPKGRHMICLGREPQDKGKEKEKIFVGASFRAREKGVEVAVGGP
jgi:hypothetical protein